jgi:hypothetical protein
MAVSLEGESSLAVECGVEPPDSPFLETSL